MFEHVWTPPQVNPKVSSQVNLEDNTLEQFWTQLFLGCYLGLLIDNSELLIGNSGLLIGNSGLLIGNSGLLIGNSGLLIGNSGMLTS
jgi:hypothetical protein